MVHTNPEPGSALSGGIIHLAIKVHRALGPGLLESVYHRFLCWELQQDGLEFANYVTLPVVYGDLRINRASEADITVENALVLEIKSVEHILSVHEAQTLERLPTGVADELQYGVPEGCDPQVYSVSAENRCQLGGVLVGFTDRAAGRDWRGCWRRQAQKAAHTLPRFTRNVMDASYLYVSVVEARVSVVRGLKCVAGMVGPNILQRRDGGIAEEIPFR